MYSYLLKNTDIKIGKKLKHGNPVMWLVRRQLKRNTKKENQFGPFYMSEAENYIQKHTSALKLIDKLKMLNWCFVTSHNITLFCCRLESCQTKSWNQQSW